MQPIQIGNFEYTQDDKGQWIYKAKPSSPLSSSDKPKYKEKPQFKLQETIENASKERFSLVLNKTVLELTNYLKENI